MATCGEMFHSRFMDVVRRSSKEHHWFSYLFPRTSLHGEKYINSKVNQIPYDNRDMFAPRWDTPVEILDKGYTLCVGYTTTKYLALRKIGYSKSRMKMLIVYIRATNQYHAILVLDNERVLNNIEKTIKPLSYYDVSYQKEAWVNELDFGEY
jgi:predicted transglutaminase-like cysteine proteinase